MPNPLNIKPFRCNNAECQQILAYTDGQHLYHGVMLDEQFVRRCRDVREEVTLECTCGTHRTWRRLKVKVVRVSTVSAVPVAVGV